MFIFDGIFDVVMIVCFPSLPVVSLISRQKVRVFVFVLLLQLVKIAY